MGLKDKNTSVFSCTSFINIYIFWVAGGSHSHRYTHIHINIDEIKIKLF